jgi:putative sigma-54 modulation protein
MQVLVTFRHIEATEALRRHAENKIDKAARKFLHRPIEAHVVLSVVKHRHIAEITLSADHLTLNATEETGDLYSAIDLAMAKLERQIQKRVTKRQSRKHAGGVDLAAASEPSAARPRRPPLKTERVPVEALSVREALRRAQATAAEYFLFVNTGSDTINLLQRRKDGSYVLVEPENVES